MAKFQRNCDVRLVCCALVLLASAWGCARKNHGAVTYVEDKAWSARATALSPGRNATLVAVGTTAELEAGAFVIPDRDTVAIFLRKAFVYGFPEMSLNKRSKRGEIAVVARILELGSGGDVDYTETAPESGRLVYYSDDVAQGQVLNLRNVPVRLPRLYTGNPLLLQAYVFELDGTPPWLKPLLHGATTLGAAAAPEAAVGLKLLDTLGAALIKDRHDDVIFSFTMAFMPVGVDARHDMPVLKAGRFALVRDEHRDPRSMLDRNLGFDAHGDLYRCPPGSGESCDAVTTPKSANSFHDDTYLVFDVVKGLKAAPDAFQETTFGQYLDKLRKTYVQRSAYFSSLIDSMTGQIDSARRVERARNEINSLTVTPLDQVAARTAWTDDLLGILSGLAGEETACRKAAAEAAKADPAKAAANPAPCLATDALAELSQALNRHLAAMGKTIRVTPASFSSETQMATLRSQLIPTDRKTP
ncbi:hypothetical protein NNJEOMEG_01844 [Fundidesulfovibrio magnetotacticus]|uniref:Lipoprotein n=1 Tax=Fundidesulfovibrio magnetotacticus TaxID=2730080 RepID=A0A6V8LW19_9BACT|nr:hypothetical protein [Fundidesulfovibrio magnetotacticus]GFK94006.1 hypothetical protein NNJEOMEG_01844 [Fundidesulfovibrio magnetotacticus]